MRFQEYVSVLYKYLGNNRGIAEYVQELFENIVNDTTYIQDIPDNTLYSYYHGNRNIGRLSKTIMGVLDRTIFEDYIDRFSDEQIEGVVRDLSKYDNKITKLNVAQKCADLFMEIIFDSTKGKSTVLEENEDKPKLPVIVVDIDDQSIVPVVKTDFSENMERNRFMKLTREDVPSFITEKVSDDDLLSYNNSLPSSEEIEEYIATLKKYEYSKLELKKNRFRVFNNGTCKANDVRIEIEFPEEIVIMDKNDMEYPEEPVRPKIKESPIDREWKKKMMGGFSDVMESFYNAQVSEISLKPVNINKLLYHLNDNYKVIDYHRINIFFDEIMHTVTDYSDFIYVGALKSGRFIAKYSVICEELEQREWGEIVIVV